MEIIETVKTEMFKTVDGARFWKIISGNEKGTRKLTSELREIISESDLTVSEIKGLLEYMKFVIDSTSYPQKK